MSDTYVYLDYAATAPLRAEALDAMMPHMLTGREAAAHEANPNSLSTPGRNAFKVLEETRRRMARALGAKRPDEIVFTSGATEADNAALVGIATAVADARSRGNKDFKPKVLISAIEHDAVLAEGRHLARMGFEVEQLKPDRDGFVEVKTLESALDDSVVLVSVQMANSEVGSIQPVQQLAQTAHGAGALFHTDATQALGKVDISLRDMGVDAASFSAHKIGGPRGVGALYLANNVPFDPFIHGGGQENGLRSGTQNVAGAVGFMAALEAALACAEDERLRLRKLRDKLYRDLATFERIQPTVEVREGSMDYLPNIVNVMVDGLESETLVLRFDALGFAVSGASACSSMSLDPSHVLTALGIDADRALGELRISLGTYTTDEDVRAFLHAVPHVLDWNPR